VDPSIKQLDYLFSPRSLAVIGASNGTGKWGFGVIQSILKDTRRFTVYPVNPKAAEVYGIKAFKRVTDIKDDLNFAVIIASVPSSSESGAIAGLNRNSIFTYRAPEDGARVISYLVNYGRYLAHA
jgi:acyl-CoA synthetase (NDP forming)